MDKAMRKALQAIATKEQADLRRKRKAQKKRREAYEAKYPRFTLPPPEERPVIERNYEKRREMKKKVSE